MSVALTAADKIPLELPTVFGNHMVLQRDMKCPVWGKASPGIEVVVNFAGQTVKGKANKYGEWRVDLAPLKMSKSPAVLKVSAGEESLERKDILVGEVWVAGGQSNMEWSIAQSMNAVEEAQAGNTPLYRHIKVDRVHTSGPRSNFRGMWQVSTKKQFHILLQ